MAIADRILIIVEPLVQSLGLDLVDVEYNGGMLRITVDQEGGLNLDTVADLSRMVSRELDEQDPITAAYTLEVSSPGLERRLRKPEHFARSVGEDITVKLAPHVEGDRRRAGKLTASDDTSITIVTDDAETLVIAMADITKARTVFDWGPTPKPGAGKGGGSGKQNYENSKNAKNAKNTAKNSKKQQKAPDRKAAAS